MPKEHVLARRKLGFFSMQKVKILCESPVSCEDVIISQREITIERPHARHHCLNELVCNRRLLTQLLAHEPVDGEAASAGDRARERCSSRTVSFK